jgi:hypothetical protein
MSFKKRQNSTRLLGRECFKDLKLWKNLLKRAVAGVSLNLLVFQNPTHVYRSDACEHGLGRYASNGHAWRYLVPTQVLGRASIIMTRNDSNKYSEWHLFVFCY